MDESRKVRHLLWRAGCGLDPDQFSKLGSTTLQKEIDRIFDESRYPNPIVLDPKDVMERADYKKASKNERKEMKRMGKKRIRNLNYECLRRMAFEKGALREKMTIFWHNHFSSETIFPGWMLKQNNIIRRHALNNFGDMLMEVSKSAVMITYLNNQQNKKGHPNENFAREVMELFTLGRGNYAEEDIKEAARAFTGWSIDINGEFVFKEKVHDSGVKKFFGKEGKLKGEDIIKTLLEQKQTARYITQKIYKEFVNEELDQARVEALANYFFDNNYDIGKLMRKIFTSDWFYEEAVIGAKIKSPIELLTGLMRTFNLTFNETNSLIKLERIMGQELFRPPNVAGWPGGMRWIDSSSLLFRMRMAEYIFNNAEVDFEAKDDLGTEMGEMNMSLDRKKPKEKTKVFAESNPQPFYDHFMQYSDGEMFDELRDYFLIHDHVKLDKDLIESKAKKGNKMEYITSLTIMILSSPQYQLC